MFKIEKGIAVPATASKKSKEIGELKNAIEQMVDGDSIFVEDNIIGHSTITSVLGDIRKLYSDRKIVAKPQKEPIKGMRIWVKFYPK